MFSHVMIGANDVEVMLAFYDAVLGTLGLAREIVQPVARARCPAAIQ